MSEGAFHLAVGDGHEIRVATAGPRDGVPALFLHGGPGSGCHPGHRALFDPDRHFAVFVDQRGAGQSRPARARHANTTSHLIADIERVREHLGLDRWLVVGGSWGATLALAFAQAHPERVTGLVLRAAFLGTRAELDWAFNTAPAMFYPTLYADFMGLLPPEEWAAPLDAYFRRILHPDPAIHRPAVLAWYETENALAELLPANIRVQPPRDRPLPATPLMEAHYFSQGCFLDRPLLDGMGAIAHLPGVIVQGRYDLLCPPATSAALAARWPAARIVFVEGAGHLITQPGVKSAVQEAIRALT